MENPPIITYEPPRRRDPAGEAVFAWFLGIAFSWFIVYAEISWMWEAGWHVVRDPFAAPLYTLFVCAIWLCAGGLLLWATWRALLIVWRVGRAVVYFVEDVANFIAARFERVREAIVRMRRFR